MPRLGLDLGQVERGVGDLDRVVGHRDLARVLLVVEHRPRRRRRRERRLGVEQHVRAELVGDAVVLAADGVERRRLQERVEVLPRRDQADVDRPDVAAVDQPQVRVAGCGHQVVLAAAAVGHQRHHLAGRAGVLHADLAAGRLLVRLDPLRLGVALPGDQVQVALGLADRATAPARRPSERSGPRSPRRPSSRRCRWMTRSIRAASASADAAARIARPGPAPLAHAFSFAIRSAAPGRDWSCIS